MKSFVAFSLIVYAFLLILGIFHTVICSKATEAKVALKKKLQDISDFPRLQLFESASPETLEGIATEFKTLIFDTLRGVEGILKYIQTRPLLAFKHSLVSQDNHTVHHLVQFFLGLRFLQTSLRQIILHYYPEVVDPEHISDPNIIENRLSLILPSMKFILSSLPTLLLTCFSFSKIEFPAGNELIVSEQIALDDFRRHSKIVLETSTALLNMSLDKSKPSFIPENSVVLYNQINWLNALICLFHMEMLRKSTFDQITIINFPPLYPLALPFQFVSLFIIQSMRANSKLLTTNTESALNVIESLAQIAEETSTIPFFDRLNSPEMLRTILQVENLSQEFVEKAKTRLDALEEIRAKDRFILLFGSRGKTTKKQSDQAVAKSKRLNQKEKYKGKNRKQNQALHYKKPNTRHQKVEISAKDETENTMELDEDKCVAVIPRELFYDSITLPIEIHFIRFGQYCFDNVLNQVLKMIPNNEHYTWTMVADYCVTNEGQDLLYKLGISLRDLNDCIQVVRRRTEAAHPKDTPVEQILKDISALLAFHHNFSPLEHLFDYINSISEWKKVLGSGIPSIDNDEIENLETSDVLTLAIIRVAQYCLDKILYPAATALGLDPTQLSMTDIIDFAENFSLIAMPDGSSLQPKLLRDCKVIYQLRNNYAHRLVTKKQAIASERRAYNGRYEKMSILKDGFISRKVNGQFY